MWILMVEAGAAFFLLAFIVWWTMYSGAKPTEDDQPEAQDSGDRKDGPQP